MPATILGKGSAERSCPQERPSLVETLAPYVCPLTLEHLASQHEPQSGPYREDFSALILRTDISGFTGLTETMQVAGLAGVESLSQMLDAYFTELVGIIDAHGGEVIKFAGDALLASWRLEAGEERPKADDKRPWADDTRRRVRDGVRCALAIRARLHGYALGAGEPLAMRVGLGMGDVSYQILGGVQQRWLTALDGPAVAVANRAVAVAQAGEVLAAPEITRFLDAATFTPAAQGFQAIHRPAAATLPYPAPARPPEAALPLDATFSLKAALPLDPALAASLLPHTSTAIRDRLVAGHMGWLAELRVLSVLFIHVPEEAGGDASLAGRQEIVCLLQEIIARFEGTIDDLDEERSGITLIAAMGLPPLAHEDNAARAVHAALQVQREMAARGARCAVAVTSGQLFCGVMGSKRRRAYCLIGDAMNQCARQMGMAADGVLCDEATARSASRQVKFEFLRRVQLRGKSAPVPVYRPLHGRPLRAPAALGMVGRVREQAAASECLQTLLAGGCAGPLLIEGEAGLGKSTLLSALLAQAEEAGVRTFFGAAESRDLARSCQAWAGIFHALLGLEPEAASLPGGQEQVRAALANDAEVAPFAALFNPVFGLELEENETTAFMSPQARAAAVLEALVRLAQRAAAEAPVLLALEDGHWLDSASWKLLAAVCERVPEILCVVATRPLEAEAPAEWRKLTASAACVRLRLTPLSATDLRALVCHRLEVGALPEVVAEFIAEKAAGNPLFAETLAFALRDAGHVLIAEGVCLLPAGPDRLAQLRFPSTVQGAIRARIDRLAPREQLTLKVASVIGRAFGRGALAAIYPLEADRGVLPETLQELARLGFIALEAEGAEAGASFAHAVIQETAYETMLFAQRRGLHARLAAWLEAHAGADRAAQYPALAHHWTMAEDTPKALEYLEKAGEQAFRRFANREAAAFLQQALTLRPVPGGAEEGLRHGRWRLQLGEAHFHLGDLHTSQGHFYAAIRLFGFRALSPSAMKWVGLPAAFVRQIWERVRPGTAVPAAAEKREPLVGAIRAFNLLGEMAFFKNDLPSAAYCCLHGLNLAERLQAPEKLVEMLAAVMMVSAALPVPALAQTYFRLAHAAAREVRDPITLADLQFYTAVYFTGLGQWEQCDTMLAAARAKFQQFGNARRLDECYCTTIYGRLHRGQFAAGTDALRALEESSARRGDAQTGGWARAMRAQLLLPTEGAEAALAALGGNPAVAIDTLTKIPYYAVSAVAHARLGHNVAARQACSEALGALTSVPPASAHMLPSAAYAAEACLTLWEGSSDADTREFAAQAAARACRILDSYARVFPVGRARALLWRSVRECLDGRTAGTQAGLSAALAVAERLGLRHDAAWVHLKSAHCALGAEEGRRHLGEAIRLFRECGASAEAAEAGRSAATHALGERAQGGSAFDL